MPSDAKKAKDAAKKNAIKQQRNNRGKKIQEKTSATANAEMKDVDNIVTDFSRDVASPTDKNEGRNLDLVDAAAATLEKIELENAQARSVAGTLTSNPKGLDHKVESLTASFFLFYVSSRFYQIITFHGREIVVDTKLELNRGRRYGLIGLNGSGKSTIMHAIVNRELPIPDCVDMYLVSREMPASNTTALQAVVDVDDERKELEHLAEELAGNDDDESQEKLMDIYDRLDEMDAELAEKKAAEILHGLGFTKTMQLKKCKDFSGGWRMRIALARALYLKPSLLLLDEPTNHLDLEACVWLEGELSKYKRTLLIVSHSQDFMNGVCTNIIHLFQKKLVYYTGNYEQFVKTRIELLENQMKRYNWEQTQLQHMKDYVARFGHGSAKLARQAQSKEKTMAKMIAGGLTEKAVAETVKQFYFFDAGPIPPPVIMVQHVSFRYSELTPWIYKNIDFGIDLDTRVALVGPNGAGKSTLLKLLCSDVMPTDGLIRRHSHVKIGRYHQALPAGDGEIPPRAQHLHEELPLEKSALEFMMSSFPEVKEKEEMRKIVGRYGITGREQVCPMKQLSDGQRCRVSFAWLAWQQPHLLLLDEPTNHLDMESIDALAEALNCFSGGMILVSHDFRLVSQVAGEVWVCDNQTITKWDGDIFSYKNHLRRQIDRDFRARERGLAKER
ncbi:ABC transporter, ATP-binding protein [Dictyocaulus viviparus]|uniref:ABC transporter, ATP-binding protein n=1 Tax=Dictyocaulus viviparus TaxID=29172 RepID=A0A0D8XJ07_DICVI|nr:ABC transporter, ATP-binding protein [Dictyocaulus viviparus]